MTATSSRVKPGSVEVALSYSIKLGLNASHRAAIRHAYGILLLLVDDYLVISRSVPLSQDGSGYGLIVT